MTGELNKTNEKKTSLPVDTIGTCKNAKNCCNWKKTYLGNGYCMECWDRGLGGKTGLPGNYIRKAVRKDHD